jgi:acetyl/propionyl-CoA carboxylase alpha subunit
MALKRVLVANRGEIAIRILRAVAEAGATGVAVYSEDDARSLHVRRADEALALRGRGAAAYLDLEQIVTLARQAGCDAVHPGYGFLSESAAFARACEAAGLTFIGPSPDTLELLGDKGRARVFARAHGVPVLPGTDGPTSLDEARAFFTSLGHGAAVVVKAVAGGGGRGMRVVERLDELEMAYARCRSEATAAFGNPDVYVERLIRRARHVEVQVVGDGTGAAIHLWERDCTLQRRHQKVIEIAPGPVLSAAQREAVLQAAVRLASAARYRNVGTFEFLIDEDAGGGGNSVVFIEANPRLQVEHTVTEAVTGIDIVRLQLDLAGGATLDRLRLSQDAVPAPRGFAIELRVNMETMQPDGSARPAGGTLAVFEPPAGPGVRVDSFGYAGYRTSPSFDSLLAKVIVHSPTPRFEDAVARARRALAEFRVEGVATNIPFLQAVLAHPAVVAGDVSTRWLEEHASELAAAVAAGGERRYFEGAPGTPAVSAAGRAGAAIDTRDPLAVLAHGKAAEVPQPAGGDDDEPGDGMVAVRAPMQGTIVAISVEPGAQVRRGQQLFVMEAMKMEHVIAAESGGVLQRLAVAAGEAVFESALLAVIEPAAVDGDDTGEAAAVDLDHIRPDLADVVARHAKTLDAARPEAVARRRETGQRTARENVDDLVDPGSFVEYGALVIAAQRARRSVEELIDRTPADGMIAGIGTVNADLVGEERARCVVMSYDYTVLAGTQGHMNHIKKDRMFHLAEQWRLPVVFFAEGGGGRPGDTDGVGGGMTTMAFHLLGKLSGLVPLVGITSGRCFAGNAAVLGCCDVVIATANSNIGMGGPAMIEGGGLGIFRPEEIGPMDVQVPNGVVDIAVRDEAEAVQAAKQYLSYFQGALPRWECADQRLLRQAIPENRLRTYDLRALVTTLADTGSVLELRRGFGQAMLTALIRIEGRPIGVVANNNQHLSGAIDSDAADKAARFMQLCDAFDIPILFLCDTPGIMVGPEVEKTALVRHASRLFVTGSSLTVPTFTVVLRKSYGLGAIAMGGGTFRAPLLTLAWPTGEFGGMGLEGSVKLGYRNELAAIADPEERRAKYEQMVARAYERGKALSMATIFEVDDVIDPADTRRLIVRGLKAVPPPPPRDGKKRPCIDTW